MIATARRWSFLWGRLIAVLSVASVILLGWLGVFAPLDEALRAARFQASDRPPSGETLFVEIDASSLAQLGVWPWPRQLHAQILDRLLDLGAAEVVFDIDFSTASTPAGDLAFEQALERAGGYAFLAAFQQVTASGEMVLNRPLARFVAHSDPVLVNVDGDGTGLLQSVPARLPEAGIVSVAAALAPATPVDGPSIGIDFGINLAAIPRISVADLLRGDPDPSLFRDKQIIIGASAVELRDFFRVPRFGVIPGPLVQLAAAETLKADRQITDFGPLPATALALILGALFTLFLHRLRLVSLAWAGAICMLAAEGAAWFALRGASIAVDTALFHFSVISLVLVLLLHERAMHWREIFRQQARLAYLAGHDPVTGALSRHALVDTLAAQRSSGQDVCLVLVQLGRLDTTIAALGHDIGEAVARQAVQRLEHALGQMPARVGQDLLAWAQLGTLTIQQQTDLCRRVAVVLDEPYLVEGHSIILDAWFGSSASSALGGDAAELLRQADVALTHARAQHAKLMIFEAEQNERIKHRRLQDVALRDALARDEFFLLYQPQVDLATGALIGVEALVRWQSRTLGLVSPAEFIPLAEETGLILSLGEWVLIQACQEASSWDWQGRLSVNVSSVQFRLGDVVANVRHALALTGFPADRLDLELTESLFVDNDPSILADLQALRQMGVGLALDDFGTGYSSLSYLTRLPIDKLKIDQSFIRPLPDPANEAIVETILLMARRLGKTVVAEGIETEEQRNYLKRLGCDVGQGYLFGRPASEQAIGIGKKTSAAA